MLSTIMALVLMTFVSVVTVIDSSASVEPSPSVLVVTLDSVHRVTPPAPLNLLDQNYTLAYGRGGYVKAIDYDYANKVMYWSVWARGPSSASIESAHMDGSERRTLVTTDLELPNGLALDTEKRVLYWCDTKLNKIESLELASNTRSTILAAPNSDIKEPNGLVLVDGDILWSEQNTGRLRRVVPNGTVTTENTVTSSLYDTRMVSKSGRNGSNACSSNNGDCSELCLATPGGRTCACATGRSADPDDPTRCVEETPKPPPK